MEKKRDLLWWLRCFVLIGSLFFMLRRCSVPASADEITLSPAQTVALLGSSISGYVYSDSLQMDVPCVARWTGMTSSQFVSSNHWDVNFPYYNFTSDSAYPPVNQAIPDIGFRQYLIYAINPVDNSLVGWPSWSTTDSSVHASFSSQFSLPITSCTSIKFSFLYTSAVYSSAGPFGDPANSSIILNTSGPVIGRNPLANSRYHSRYFNILTPFYDSPNGDYSNVPENNRLPLSLIPLDYSGSEPFSISGFNASLNMVSAFHNVDPSPLYNTWQVGNYVPLLYIECPTISDYVPATTAPVTTPVPASFLPAQSTAVHGTVDLSHLESGVAAIVEQGIEANQNLEWIGNNMYIGVNNLALISYQLQQIYDEMVNRGEIAVNLIPADPLAQLRTDIHSQIHDNLTSFTTSRMPDEVASGFSFFNDLYSRFTSGPLAFFGWIGIFSLMSLVSSWFIFRGRS